MTSSHNFPNHNLVIFVIRHQPIDHEYGASTDKTK